MKKFVALMLSFMLILSLAACGSSKSSSSSSSSASSQSETSKAENDKASSSAGSTSVQDAPGGTEAASDADETEEGLKELLKQLSLIEPTDDLAGTKWEFSGGLLDGVEMDQDEAEQSLQMYGGTLEIVFDDTKNISMIQGNGTLKGSYRIMSDSKIMEIIFDNAGSSLKYAGLLTDVDGTIVLMLLSDETGQNAVYFTQSGAE